MVLWATVEFVDEEQDPARARRERQRLGPIFDEFKDAEDDAKYRKELAVPRGLISFRELTIMGIVVVLAQVSMARVLPRVPDALREKFLTSPRLGMEAVKDALESGAR